MSKQEEEGGYHISFKVSICGDTGVGKSNLLSRFTRNEFSMDSKTTIGVEFATKNIPVEGNKIVKAQIWDTAGQERLESMTKAFYRDAVGAFFVFDVNNLNSLENLKKVWINQLKEFGYSGVKRVLIGNKIDVKGDMSKKCRDAAIELAEIEGIDYYETSALSGEGVDAAFRRLILHVASLLPDVRLVKCFFSSIYFRFSFLSD